MLDPNVATKSRRKRPSASRARPPRSGAAATASNPNGRKRWLGSGKDPTKSGCKEVVLIGSSHRDADRRRGAEAVQGPDDHPFAQEAVVEGPGVLPRVHIEEVRDRALAGVEAVL